MEIMDNQILNTIACVLLGIVLVVAGLYLHGRDYPKKYKRHNHKMLYYF